jgi:hypothetical protein
VLFHIVCTFGVRSLFLSVICERIGWVQRNKNLGSEWLSSQYLTSEKQQTWVEGVLVMLQLQRLRAPGTKVESVGSLLKHVQERLYICVVDWRFEAVVICSIFLNMLLVSTFHFTEPEGWREVQEGFEWFFAVLFSFEIFLRILGTGPWQYFALPINFIDFALIVSALALQSLDAKLSNVLIWRIMRIVIRLFRALTEGGILPDLRNVLMLLTISFPSILAVFLLLVLLIFCYAVIGQAWFFNVEGHRSINQVCVCVRACVRGVRACVHTCVHVQYVNFHDVTAAFSTLLSCLTGENWGSIMQDCIDNACMMNTPDLYRVGCGGFMKSTLFFISFLVIARFQMCNLIIGIFLKNLKLIEQQRVAGISIGVAHSCALSLPTQPAMFCTSLSATLWCALCLQGA